MPYFGRRFNEKRYIRTWLGRTWLLLRPLMLVVSQALVFGGILRVATPGTPYMLAFLVGMIGWNTFAESAYWSTRSLELNRGSLRELHIPRVILLVASAVPALVDCLIFFAFLLIAAAAYAVADGTTHLDLTMVPATGAGLALLLALGLSIGTWLAVPGAQARDVRFGLRFALAFWYLLTPIIYPLSEVPDRYRTLIELNPVTAPIELVKVGLLGQAGPPWISLVSCFGSITLIGVTGLVFFWRAEAAALDHL